MPAQVSGAGNLAQHQLPAESTPADCDQPSVAKVCVEILGPRSPSRPVPDAQFSPNAALMSTCPAKRAVQAERSEFLGFTRFS